MRDFIQGLPKAELHVHHVGSASPRVVADLAARYEGQASATRGSKNPVPADPELLAEYFTFTDFRHFIELYLSVVDLIRTPEDIRDLTYGVARDMAAQNIRYAELTCTPYSHLRRGIDAMAYLEAIEDARVAAHRDFGLTLKWIFDIPGESGPAAAADTVALIEARQPEALVGFGLGGPEIGVPRPQFAPHFERALALGLHSVPHAGESTGPETVWDSLRHLKAERIGHGTSLVQDPELVAYLGEHRIPIEVCPTSNIATGVVKDLDQHPIRAMVQAGLLVTVNSDDPPMFGTDLNHEYEVAAKLLGLDERGIAELAKNAVQASYQDAEGKRTLAAEIDAYTAQAR
ncbi:adenosine deaminase [Catenulispora pinisilvae]|uniref:adenosine deaminase n=1 Tax=Catenulispora pinisilvae TaxID=2705253 RepID=UPI001891A8D6|nr:adenosine deaminase [Catenulispora pinisilvae]